MTTGFVQTLSAACGDQNLNHVPTVSVAYDGPDAMGHGTLTVTYSFPNTDSGSDRTIDIVSNLAAPSNFYARYSSLLDAGSFTVPINMTCRTGDFWIKARAVACNGWGDPRYETWSNTASASVSADPNPISVSYNGPDSLGHGTLTVNYNFPNTDSPSQRTIDIVSNLAAPSNFYASYSNFQTQSGSFTIPLNFTCRTGDFWIKARAVACGRWNDPGGEQWSDAATVTVSSDPTPITVSFNGPENRRNGILTVSYNFPNTDSPSQRTIDIVSNLAAPSNFYARYTGLTAQSGSFTVPLNLKCGDYWVMARAVACDGWGDAGHEEWSSQEQISATGTISADLSLRNAPVTSPSDATKVHVDLKYDMGDFSNGGTVRLDLVSYIDNEGRLHGGSDLSPNGSLITSFTTATQTGTWSFDYTAPSSARHVEIQATLTSCAGVARKVAGVDLPPCCPAPSGTNEPVFFSDGNMRYSDTDPLPRLLDSYALTRHYDNQQRVSRLFGLGWTSMLDQQLAVNTTGNTLVSLVDADNAAVVFEQVSTNTFVQRWPRANGAPGRLSYDGATYQYLPARSAVASRFRGSDGRFIGYRDLPTNRTLDITLAPNGDPLTATDSWTGVTWTFTVDATMHRVTSIAIGSLTWGYTYDAGGNLLSVSAPGSSPWRTYEYNSIWGMTAAKDPLGNLIESHTYDANGRGISSVGRTDEISSIAYGITAPTAGDTITRVTTNAGATIDYVQRAVDGVLRTVHVDGGCTACGSRNSVFAFDDSGRVIREQTADGYVTVTTYAATGGVVSSTQKYLQPAGCDPQTATNQCRLTENTIATAALDPTPATVTATYAYGDANWPDRPTSMTTASVLNPSGSRVETWTYDALSGTVLVHTTSGWTGSPAQTEDHTTTTALYNGAEGAAFTPGGSFDSSWLTLAQPMGARKSIDGPRTDVADTTTFVYYPVESSVPTLSRGRLAAVKNALGHIMLYESYDAFGNAQRIIDANGVATELTFDALGRPLTTTVKGVGGCDASADPLCATDLTSSRTYSPPSGPLTTTTDANGNVVKYEYDARGRTSAILRGSSLSALQEQLTYTYDPATGKKSRETYSANVSGSWIEKRSESYTYDSLAQLSAITHPDATSIAWTYDGTGAVATIRDENHSSANTTYAYDQAHRLATVRQTLGTGTITTSYAYDIAGNLISVTDPNGNVTTYTYDDFGQMLSQVSPVTGTTTYAYDTAGNTTSTRDANDAVTARTYDALNRPLSAVSSRGAETEEVTWTWDDGTSGANGIGRLASSSSTDSTENYAYDRRGLLLRENVSIWGDAFTQSYAYDAAGNRTLIGYPSGRVVTYGFDFAGRPVTASGTLNGENVDYVTSASYLPFGPLASLSLGNGTVETRTYDQRYQASALQLTAAAGATLAQYAYGHDAAGNVTQATDLTDTTYNRTFGYDDLNRLITANSGAGLWGSGSYTYDAMGNMLTANLGSRTRTFTYTGTSPRIATAIDNGETTSMTYDDAGNELSGPSIPLGNGTATDARSYSSRNLLQQVTLTSPYCLGPRQGEICHAYAQGYTTITNGFNSQGLRVASTTSNSVRPVLNPWPPYYFYTPELTPLNSVGIDGMIDLIWFSGRPVGDEYNGSLLRHYTLTDPIGTPILQSDPTGAITWRAEYEPFGNVYFMRTGSRNDQALRFPGQQVAFTNFSGDEENYNIFRWYRSGWGRMTQADPIGVRGGTTLGLNHLYGYAGANPLVNVDPTGLYTLGASCNDKLCGPPSPGLCNGNPRSSVCIDDLFRKMRDTIRTNKKCAKAIDSFGGTFNAADVIRSSFRSTGGPLVTCNANDCDPSKFGGSARPSYNPLTKSIPACLSLYDSDNSLMHEVLHYFGVGDDTAQQRTILKNCYPNSEP